MGEIAAYIRVSTQKQKEENSHVRQRERIKEWAERNDHSIDSIAWYEDIAISGQSDQRESYSELMNEYEQYELVVVRELSRFGRDPVRILTDIEDIGESDTEFVSVTEPMFDTTTAQGRYFLRSIANMNAFHADIRREQAQLMIERRREEGKPIGRPKKLSKEQLEQVYEWRETDLSYGTISVLVDERFGIDVSRETVRRYCNEEGVEPEVEA